MAKIIFYHFAVGENSQGEQILQDKAIDWSEANEEIAKKEAYNGEYTIEDDGIEEIQSPSQLDQIEAQVTYTAMITNTLIQ